MTPRGPHQATHLPSHTHLHTVLHSKPNYCLILTHTLCTRILWYADWRSRRSNHQDFRLVDALLHLLNHSYDNITTDDNNQCFRWKTLMQKSLLCLLSFFFWYFGTSQFIQRLSLCDWLKCKLTVSIHSACQPSASRVTRHTEDLHAVPLVHAQVQFPFPIPVVPDFGGVNNLYLSL